MPSKTSAQEKKRLQSLPQSKRKLAKQTKTVDIKLQEPTEEEKRAKVFAAFSTPDEDALAAFRKISKEKKKISIANSKKASTACFLAKPPSKGKKYSIDLRIHTPGTIGYFLSGGISPGPALGRLAKVKGLDIIGLTNFYDSSLVDTITEKTGDVCVLPGFDLRCVIGGCNEVYFTALFPEGTKSGVIAEVLNQLQVPKGSTRAFYLTLPVAQVIKTVEQKGGVLIPTRLDKTPNRLSAIKELVETHGFRVFDIIHPESIEFFKERWPDGGFTFLSFSNAGALAQIGTRTSEVKLTTGGFAGLKELLVRQAA
jgi:hypothetical protein